MTAKTKKTAMLTQGAYELATSGVRTVVIYHRDGVSAAPISEDGVVIGRVAPADLVIDDSSLSRRHARVALEGDRIVVEDLGSTNGTWVNGRRIDRAELSVGAELVVGALSCVVQSATPALGARWGMLGHDAFVDRVEREAQRARYFGRSFAVGMIARRGEKAHVRYWADELTTRPVDSRALFSDDTLELCMPEVEAAEAASAMRTLREALSEARIGVAMFPADGSSAEALIAACRRNLNDEERAPSEAHTSDIVAVSAEMREAMETARLLARGVIPVLLQGETGVGKEVLARYIHAQSPRHEKPFIALNCGAIPPQLVESTLFGHEKGAFTGASSRRAGVFEAAEDGTLFLDEIGELPPAAQAALLRVLETKRIVRVGATKEVDVSARIIAASHRDLEQMAEDGLFRKDLLFRLNAMTLRIPPLRERRADIPVLAQRFLAAANENAPSPVPAIASDAMHALEHHGWPGNVRELRNAIERGVLICRHGELTRDDLPERVRRAVVREQRPEDEPEVEVAAKPIGPSHRRPDEDFRACMERLETEVIVTVLDACNWNKAEAARRLRMPRRTLVHRIKALGIAPPER